MTKLKTPASSLQAISEKPVSRQNAWKSATAARSVASTRKRSPGASARSARLARSTGSGQFMPLTSNTVSLMAGILRPATLLEQAMSAPYDFRIGIDLGGTKTEIVALGRDGAEVHRSRVATPPGYEASVASMV